MRGSTGVRRQPAYRRYLSGMDVMRPSGSYTPSGLVVPMSPGEMALMETDAREAVVKGAVAVNASAPIIIIRWAMACHMKHGEISKLTLRTAANAGTRTRRAIHVRCQRAVRAAEKARRRTAAAAHGGWCAKVCDTRLIPGAARQAAWPYHSPCHPLRFAQRTMANRIEAGRQPVLGGNGQWRGHREAQKDTAIAAMVRTVGGYLREARPPLPQILGPTQISTRCLRIQVKTDLTDNLAGGEEAGWPDGGMRQARTRPRQPGGTGWSGCGCLMRGF